MRRKIKAVFALFWLLGCFVPAPERPSAQERDSIAERILNPLPEYDPFDKRPPSPQFFPDEVDRRVRAALIDSLTHREGNLEEHVRFLIHKDAELKRERGAVTGLTEHVSDLFHNTIRDRDRYLAAQRKALSSTSSPEQKQLIESRLRNDDLNQAQELLSKSATNRWGAMLNRLLSSVDLASILSGSYIGAAVDSTISQLLAAGSATMPVEERRALTLLLEHLKRYPDDPQNGEVQKQADALEKRKKGVLLQKQIEKAEEAIGKRDLTRAALHYEMAAFVDPLSREVEEGVERLKKLARDQEEARKKGLAVDLPPRAADSAEDPELSGLVYALIVRDPARIEAEAKALEEKYRGRPQGEAARDALAVALEIRGRHEEAKKTLEQIARSSHAAHEKGRAQLLLKSPEYNLLASFHEARSEHRLQTVKYVLLGEDFLKKNLLYSTAPLVVSGPAGAGTVAAANVMMIGSNLMEVLTSSPISYQQVIDRGVAYVRNHPQSESSAEVYNILADAYEGLGMFDKAIAYHEMSGKATEKKVADLKGKAAGSLLEAAQRSGEKRVQESHLQAILERYPESAAAKEATKKLAQLSRTEHQGLRMSKKFLMENPELYGPQGLRLKATLFDGSLSNMELADQGVSLSSESEILLHLQTPWGIRSQAYPIEKEATDRFQMALRKKNYEVAIGDIHTRDKGSSGGMKTVPLSLLRGELDRNRDRRDGEPEDTTLTLVREARGPSPAFSKVLDYSLLSEAEQNPASLIKLPPIQGSISASGLTLGSPLPIPLFRDFIPVDFLLQGRPGRFSVFPKIHLHKDRGDDQELYR
jgi:hypothetical protein